MDGVHERAKSHTYTEVTFRMRYNLSSGVIAGLVAGVIFGVMMQMMSAPTPDGREVPMMMMVAQVVKSNSLAVGWLYHLFNSAVIGGIFGWLLGTRTTGRLGAGAGWGAVYGFAWWILGALILMPIFLGMPAFAPLRMAPMRPVAMGSLMGHLIFGAVLGVTFGWLSGRAIDRRIAATGPAR
jgi:F0F1-type ATP synthase assembly protein I